MKNTIILVLVSIILLSFSNNSEVNVKLGYINSSIIHESPEILELNARIESFTSKQKEELSIIENEAQKAMENNNENLYNEKQGEWLEKSMKMEEAIKNKRKELIQPYLDQVNEKIKELAKNENYSIIFDTNGSILYAEDELNLTEKLKSKIGF